MSNAQWSEFSLKGDVPEGLFCLEASAGTGKTYTIEGLVTRLIAEKGIELEELLIVTYTRAATAELKTRIRETLNSTRMALEHVGVEASSAPSDSSGEHVVVGVLRSCLDEAGRSLAIRRLRRAAENFEDAQISTIHGFCQRTLQEFAFDSGVSMDVALQESMDGMIREVAQDWWTLARHEQRPYFIEHLTDRKVSVATLMSIAKAVAAHPEAPRLPEALSTEGLSERLEQWEAALHTFRAVWPAGAPLIREALAQSLAAKYLSSDKKEGYLDSLVEGYCQQVSLWLNREAPSPFQTRALAKFGREGLDEKTLSKCKKDGQVVSHPLIEEVDALLWEAQRASAQLDAAGNHFLGEFAAFSKRELTRRKQAQRVLGFNDLLSALHDCLVGNQANPALLHTLQRKYRVALIDEFQDTDAPQWEIFQAIFSGEDHSLIVVGDPKQAIYSFRGADIETYLKARDLPEMHRATMGVNHRSDQPVVQAVSALYRHGGVSQPFLNENIGYPEVRAQHTEARFWLGDSTPPGLVFTYMRRSVLGKRPKESINGYDIRAPEQIAAQQIVDFLYSGAEVADEEGVPRPVRPSDVAILVRSNKDARHAQEELRRLGVPSTVRSDQSVFAGEEALSLERILEAVLNAGRASRVREALLSSLVGLGVSTLAHLETAEEEWSAWITTLRGWKTLWAEKGFATFARALTTTPLPLSGDGELQTLPERLLGWSDGERRATNLFHLLEILQEAVTTERLSAHGLKAWLHRHRQAAMDETQAKEGQRQVRLESDEDAVTISTIHKSKGLQYGFVWCPRLCEGARVSAKNKLPLRFRNPEMAGGWCLDLGIDLKSDSKEERIEYVEASQREENLRLMYVALTRARHQVHVLVGGFNKLASSGVGHLVFPEFEEPHKVADDVLFEELNTLCEALGTHTALTDLAGWLPTRRYTRPVLSLVPAAAEFRDGGFDWSWRRVSFSRLAEDHGANDDTDPDHDETLKPGLEDAPALVGGEIPAESYPLTLRELKGGRTTGDCLHDIYEHHDFQDPEALAAQVRVSLTKYGFDAEEWTERVTQGLQETLDTPLGLEPELTLGALPNTQRLNELEFTFPLATQSDAPALTVSSLAQCFAEHGGTEMHVEYAKRIRQLTFRAARGFLNGSIDLVFEHAGRWYVVDYKSNTLGKTSAQYTRTHMLRAMFEGEYILQYHIYCVALHRLLSARLQQDYNFEEHFGGVMYLFARGMSPHHPAGTGVFTDRPEKSLIEALNRHFGGDH